MKFSATIIAAVAATTVTDVSAFGVNSGFAIRQSTFASSPSSLYALADLESKLLSDEPAPKAKKEKREKVVREPRAKKSKAAPAPEPVPEPEPVVEVKPAKKGKKSKAKTSQYEDLGDIEVKAKKGPPKASAPKPINPKPVKPKVERPKKEKAPKAAAAPKAAVDADPNAKTVGVALGAAPLVLAPFLALSAARGALSSTVARREEIQQEIAAKEAAAAKVERQSDVDGAGVAGALVSYIVEESDLRE